MNEVSPKIVKKIQTLTQIAAELRQGKHFNMTRFALLKSLCSDPEAAANFALHIANPHPWSKISPKSGDGIFWAEAGESGWPSNPS